MDVITNEEREGVLSYPCMCGGRTNITIRAYVQGIDNSGVNPFAYCASCDARIEIPKNVVFIA